MSYPPWSLARRGCRRGPTLRRPAVAILLALAFLAGIVVAALHHHADHCEHDDCSSCQFAATLAAALVFSILLMEILHLAVRLAAPSREETPGIPCPRVARPRAPPAAPVPLS